MAFTLSEMISGSLSRMGGLRVSITTSSGTTTTALDSFLVGQTSDDDYKYAPWFCLSSAAASGANVGVLTGEFMEVASYQSGTGQFTLSSACSSKVENGTRYAIGTPEFRLQFLIEKANEALLGLGDLDNIDTASIGTSAATTDYTLPVAMKRSAPLRVDVQTDTTSSGDSNAWVTIHDWEYQPAAAGTAGTLILPDSVATGRDLRVWYVAPHGRVSAYNSVIDERVHPELAILALTEKLYEFRNSMNRGSMAFDVQRWNDAKTQLVEARTRFPIWGSQRKPKLLVVGDDVADHLPYPYPYGPA